MHLERDPKHIFDLNFEAMIFNDEIDKSELETWFAATLDRHHVCRYSQLTCRTEQELLDSDMSMGTVRHIYLLLIGMGMNLRDGENCLCSLGLRYRMLNRLRDNFIDNLDDLEQYSLDQLIDDCGIPYDVANYISWKMRTLGRSLAN